MNENIVNEQTETSRKMSLKRVKKRLETISQRDTGKNRAKLRLAEAILKDIAAGEVQNPSTLAAAYFGSEDS